VIRPISETAVDRRL